MNAFKGDERAQREQRSTAASFFFTYFTLCPVRFNGWKCFGHRGSHSNLISFPLHSSGGVSSSPAHNFLLTEQTSIYPSTPTVPLNLSIFCTAEHKSLYLHLWKRSLLFELDWNIPSVKVCWKQNGGKNNTHKRDGFFSPAPPPPAFFFFYSSKCNPRGLQTSSLLQTMKCLIKQQHDRACGTGRLLMCTQSFRWVNIYLDEPLAWQPNSISGRRPPPPSPAFWVIPYRLYVAFAPWRHFTLSHRELISSIENQLARFQENGEISLHKSLFFYYYFFPSSSLSPSECR